MASSTLAVDKEFIGTDGDWSEDNNWNPVELPIDDDEVMIGSGNVVTISEDVGTNNSLGHVKESYQSVYERVLYEQSLTLFFLCRVLDLSRPRLLGTGLSSIRRRVEDLQRRQRRLE